MISSPHPLCYRVNEACAAIGIGRSSLYALIANGKLKAIRIAGRTLIPSDELDRLIEEARG